MTKNYETLKHLALVGRTSARSLLFLAFCSFASAFNALAKDIERMPLIDNAGLAPVHGLIERIAPGSGSRVSYPAKPQGNSVAEAARLLEKCMSVQNGGSK
jgi:hypothetical protein